MAVLALFFFGKKNAMKYLLIIALLGLGFQCLVAQARLEGTVRDTDSGEPIALGTVALCQNGVLVKGTETDFEGYYCLTDIDVGEYEVEFSNTGYFPLKFVVVHVASQTNKLDATLEAGLELEILSFC